MTSVNYTAPTGYTSHCAGFGIGRRNWHDVQQFGTLVGLQRGLAGRLQSTTHHCRYDNETSLLGVNQSVSAVARRHQQRVSAGQPRQLFVRPGLPTSVGDALTGYQSGSTFSIQQQQPLTWDQSTYTDTG